MLVLVSLVFFSSLTRVTNPYFPRAECVPGPMVQSGDLEMNTDTGPALLILSSNGLDKHTIMIIEINAR